MRSWVNCQKIMSGEDPLNEDSQRLGECADA